MSDYYIGPERRKLYGSSEGPIEPERAPFPVVLDVKALRKLGLQLRQKACQVRRMMRRKMTRFLEKKFADKSPAVRSRDHGDCLIYKPTDTKI